MPPTPHDALVRAIFGQPQHAAAELGAVLPAELVARLDLGSLVPIDATFLDEELRASAADLVFAAQFKDGSPARLLVLIEHQSTLDRRLPLRLLAYQTRLLEEWAAEHQAEASLPGIVAVVIHQGPKPWPFGRSFQEAMGSRGVTERCGGLRLLDFEFVVDDLAVLSDAQLLARGTDVIARLTWFALRHGRDRSDLLERMLAAFRALAADLRGPDVAPALLRLARYVCDVSDEPKVAVSRALATAVPAEARSSFMTIAEQWLEEGREQGRAQALRETLRELLSTRFGRLSPMAADRLASADVETLQRWIRNFVAAPSQDALLGS